MVVPFLNIHCDTESPRRLIDPIVDEFPELEYQNL